MKYKAVFINKDVTLIKNTPPSIELDKVQFYTELVESIQTLKDHNFKIIGINNQPEFAKETSEESVPLKIKTKINELTKKFSTQVDATYDYAHELDQKQELILKAAKELSLDIPKSWVIGDVLNDIEAGNSAGCRTILVHNGGEKKWVLNNNRVPTFIVKKMRDAVAKIFYYEKYSEVLIRRGLV